MMAGKELCMIFNDKFAYWRDQLLFSLANGVNFKA